MKIDLDSVNIELVRKIAMNEVARSYGEAVRDDHFTRGVSEIAKAYASAYLDDMRGDGHSIADTMVENLNGYLEQTAVSPDMKPEFVLGYSIAQAACSHAQADLDYFEGEFRERALEADPMLGSVQMLLEDDLEDLDARQVGVDTTRSAPIGTVSYEDVVTVAPWLTPAQAEGTLDDVAASQQSVERDLVEDIEVNAHSHELDADPYDAVSEFDRRIDAVLDCDIAGASPRCVYLEGEDIDYRCWKDRDGALWFPESSIKGIMASLERAEGDPIRLVNGKVIEYVESAEPVSGGGHAYPLLPARECEPHTAPNGETVWDAANDFVWDFRVAPAHCTELGEKVWRGTEPDGLMGFFTSDDLFKAYCADPGLDEQRLAGTTFETWVAEMERMGLLMVAATERLRLDIAASMPGELSADKVTVDADDAFAQKRGGLGLLAWETAEDDGPCYWFRRDGVLAIQAETARVGGDPIVWEGDTLVQYKPIDQGAGPEERPLTVMAPSVSPFGEPVWPAAPDMGWEVTSRDGEPVASAGVAELENAAQGVVEARGDKDVPGRAPQDRGEL